MIKKSGKVLFPFDINDVAGEVEIQNVETQSQVMDSMCTEPFSPDHDNYRYWVHPDPDLHLSVEKGIQSTVTLTNTLCQTESESKDVQVQTVCSRKSVGVQIDTFKDSVSNLTKSKIEEQSKVIKELTHQLYTLKEENVKLHEKEFCAETIVTSDANTNFYTGLPDVVTFNALFTYLEPKAKKLCYWQGSSSNTTTHVKVNPNKGPPRKLTLRKEFFAVLVRLKLGLLVEDIADRFDIAPSQFSKIFNTWIRFLHLELNLLFPYPDRQKVEENMPDSFKKFPNTRMVIDCTEIFVQKHSALRPQRETWSSYKHRNTYKSLVGITPDGAVCFVSDLYGGAASDKFIVNDCGILDLIESGDNIMADRGFEIEPELRKRGAGLNIPPLGMGSSNSVVQMLKALGG